MVSEKIIDKALGGKKAIACDSCIHKRARWYCAADDAFLCQACDASVHSANPLARRHERVRLKTSSLRLENSVPSWHKGFTKKARTPRHAKQQKLLNFDEKTNKNSISSAPEVCLDENSREEHELIFRVPSCDPLLLSGNSKDLMDAADHASKCKSKDSDLSVKDSHHEVKSMHDIILPSELDMVEFAADVESLLGKSHDDDCYEMEQYFNNAKNLSSLECCSSDSREVKLEGYRADKNSDNLIARKQLDIGFDHESAANCGNHEEIKAKKEDVVQGGEVIDEDFKEKGISLCLDYEAIIASWSIHETPWFTGDGPRLDLKESWTDHYMGTGGLEVTHLYGGFPGMGKHMCGHGGREARVSRYREKRRTRLFSKKIRYEVRKLNAENRPRMKGRFVKRAALSPSLTLLKKY